MARSIVSLGMLAALALSIAYRSDRFSDGFPPPERAAMMMCRASLLQRLPRRLSTTAFLCLIRAQCECPAMTHPNPDPNPTLALVPTLILSLSPTPRSPAHASSPPQPPPARRPWPPRQASPSLVSSPSHPPR